MRGVSMRDIARRVGVSAVTVSKALSGRSGVSEETRRLIEKTAADMGYVNPRDAQAEEARAMDVGILVPERYFAPDAYYATICGQLVNTLSAAGHFGVLELLTAGMEMGGTLPNLLRAGRVDAVILLGQPDAAYLRTLTAQSVPLVFLDFYDEGASADAVVGDNAYGCYQLTSHLIGQGHRDIGFVGSCTATSSIMDRYLGFYRAMLMHGLPIRPECVLPDRDGSARLIQPQLPQRLPTAFVCNCDLVALRTIAQLRERGVRVPEDVSVVGFDDFCALPDTAPSLTTFRLDTQAMVQIAVRMATERRTGVQRPFGRVVVGGQPIYRSSDAPPSVP